MGKKSQSKGEDPYKVGTVIFSAGDSKHDDVWDDSELIKHWDENVEAFRRLYSDENQETEENSSPFQHNLRKTKDGSISKKKPLTQKTKQAFHTQLPRQRPSNSQSNSQMPYSEYENQPPPPSSFLPPMPPLPTSQEELSNLIMAWYYCGYYTGIYQAQRK